MITKKLFINGALVLFLAISIFVTTLFYFSRSDQDLSVHARSHGPPPEIPILQEPLDDTWINTNPTFIAQVFNPAMLDVQANFNWARVGTNPLPPSDTLGSVVVGGGPGNSSHTWTPDLTDGVYDWRASAVDSDGGETAPSNFWRVKKDTLDPTATCGTISVSENRISFKNLPQIKIL